MDASIIFSNITTGALNADTVTAAANDSNKSVVSAAGSLSAEGKVGTLTAVCSTYIDDT